MFSEIGNIQSRPTITLFERRGFSVRTWNEFTGLSASLIGADYFPTVVNGQPASEIPSTVSASLISAGYFPTIVNGQPASEIPSTVSASLISADYFPTIVDGQPQNETSTLTASLDSADYFFAIVNGQPTSEIPSSLTVNLQSCNYVIP